MKTKLILAVIALCCIVSQLLAQNSPAIVGTWEMIEFNATDFESKAMKRDVNKIKQYKMITPTHWMYIVKDTQSDTLIQDGNYGTYTLNGDKYVEKVDNATTQFIVRVEGNKLYQDGVIIRPDGKKAVLHEVYQKMEATPNTNKQYVGAWNLLSSEVIKDGKKERLIGVKEMFILTPTHYMYVGSKGDKVESVAVGTYIAEANKLKPTQLLATNMRKAGDKIEVNAAIQGDKLMTQGVVKSSKGEKKEWSSVYQKASSKAAKVVSNTK